MLVDPGNVGFALDGQIVLRWRFFFQVFSGLSPPPWQAPKYSAGRDGSDWTQLGMIISGNRIRSERRICQRVLAARRARVVLGCSALFVRGRREDRVRAAPAVSCAMCTKKCAHEHTGPAENTRPSLRNGFTAYSVLFL